MSGPTKRKHPRKHPVPPPRWWRRDKAERESSPSIVPGFPDEGPDYHVENGPRGPELVLHEGTTSEGNRL